MKRLTALALSLLVALTAFAQKTEREHFSPKKGNYSLGISINPVAGATSFQPKANDFSGSWIASLCENPQQMFMLSPQSLTSVRFKYFATDKLAVKASLGFTGSHINYKEYVQDDLAKSMNPASEAKVVDQVKSNLNGASLMLGIESNLGKGPVRFTYGLSVLYAIGGGTVNFTYGNEFAPYNNWTPSTMANQAAKGKLNDYDTENPKFGIAYARPVKRNNIGYVQDLGLAVDLGVEWFVVDRISLALNASVLPLLFTWQPQTWGVYEGYSTETQNVHQYNRLVSPGSNGLTYGLGNFGLDISVSYWF